MFTVEELLEAVEQMGILTEQPLVLYTQPRSVHFHTSRGYDCCNCLVEAIEQLFRVVDPETEKASRGDKSNIAVLASDTFHACVVIDTRVQGWEKDEWNNHSTCIKIWAPADVIPRIVQRLVEAQNGDPIGSGVDWNKIEKVWKIQRADAIAQWRAVMSDARVPDAREPDELTSAAMADNPGVQVCRKCGTKNTTFALFCTGCGESVSGRD